MHCLQQVSYHHQPTNLLPVCDKMLCLQDTCMVYTLDLLQFSVHLCGPVDAVIYKQIFVQTQLHGRGNNYIISPVAYISNALLLLNACIIVDNT